MQINRLVILVHVNEDSEEGRGGSITIDGESVDGISMDWLPKFYCDVEEKDSLVHAVQWFGDHGEVELITCGNNVDIKELGVFEQAKELFDNRKEELAKEEAAKQVSMYESDEYDLLELYGDSEASDINN